MKKYYIILLAITFIVSSCGSSKREKTLSSASIEKKYVPGVVLVKNMYYYTITFSNGAEMYFSGVDDDGDISGLCFNQEEVEPVCSFGTGFFISKDGQIVTNSHVAVPQVDVTSVRSQIVQAFNILGSQALSEINEINEKLGALRVYAGGLSSYDPEYQEAVSRYKELDSQREQYEQIVGVAQMVGYSDYQVSITQSIGVAYSNTFVSSLSDFKECTVTKNDVEHDLAVIQLDNHVTPKEAYIFKVGTDSEKSKPSARRRSRKSSKTSSKKRVGVGEVLYVIGYNMGPTLALTKEGIKPQVTRGEVSQDTDDYRMMYTVPTMHGSSGAPVIDKHGKLVAINYAGIDKTQSFNYGIRVKHLINLLNE